MTTRTVPPVALALVALAASTASGQPAPPPPEPSRTPTPAATTELGPLARFHEQVELTVGNVDVTVLDSHGRPVVGLTADNFALEVDGVRRTITNFSAPTPPALAPSATTPTVVPPSDATTAPAQAGAGRQPRVILILVDNNNTSVFHRNGVLKQLKGWISDNLRAPDRAVVAVYQNFIRYVSPLSSNPDEIVGALDDLLAKSSGVGGTEALRAMAEGQIRDLAESSNPASQVRSTTVDQALATARMNAVQMRNAAVDTINSFKLLLRTMSGLPGRKAVLYISDGLPRSPGLETFQLVNQLFLQTNLSDTEFQTYQSTDLYTDLARWAAAADVTLYTVDARGVTAGSERTAENEGRGVFLRSAGAQQRLTDIDMLQLHNYQDPLVAMANLTGGIAVVDTNDFRRGLARIAEAMETTYSLGFELEPRGQDAFHAVRVAIKGRSGLRLRYRASLVERSLATITGDRTVAGLGFNLKDDPIGIRLQLGHPVAAGRQRWSLPVKILVPVGNLALVREGDDFNGSLIVYTVATDGRGHHSPLGQQRHSIVVPADKIDRVGTLAIDTAVEVGEGDCRVSVGVLDEVATNAGYTTADTTIGGT
jgi:VWFA-related protein